MISEKIEAYRAQFEQRFYAEFGLEPLRSGPGYVEAAASDAWEAYKWAVEDCTLQHITEFGEMQDRALSHPKSIEADSGVIAAPVDHVPDAGKMVADRVPESGNTMPGAEPVAWQITYASADGTTVRVVPGWTLVPVSDLEELYHSIHGNRYMGEDWEKKCISSMMPKESK